MFSDFQMFFVTNSCHAPAPSYCSTKHWSLYLLSLICRFARFRMWSIDEALPKCPRPMANTARRQNHRFIAGSEREEDDSVMRLLEI